VVALRDMSSTEDAVQAAERLAATIALPVVSDLGEVPISCRLGLSFYPRDGSDANTLLTRADIAAGGTANTNSRPRVLVFRSDMEDEFNDTLALYKDLGNALSRNEFRLAFQPIVDVRNRELIALEAMLRWQHPKRGLLAARDFLGLMAGSPLMTSVGEWVIHEACAAKSRWQGKTCKPVGIAINVSASQFSSAGFARTVRTAIESNGLAAHEVVLELTERELLRDASEGRDAIAEITKLGVRLSLDNFGSGYSCLAHIRTLSTDQLKIAAHLIGEIGTGPDYAAIVGSIVQMARELNLELIATGVETAQQLNWLMQHGCQIQGHYIGRPVPEQELDAYLNCAWDSLAVGTR
jgi:EAL domain-containing protein (putative c-di-GMP-specific phosphodiesterase class I)